MRTGGTNAALTTCLNPRGALRQTSLTCAKHDTAFPQVGGIALQQAARIVKILLIRFDGIGDAVILAPLIAALQAAGHPMDIILSERNRDVFAPHVFDMVFSVPWKAWKTRSIKRDFSTLLTALRERCHDTALIATEELAAYRLARAADIPQRRGFENGWEKPLKSLLVRFLCTNTIYRPGSLRENEHEARVQYRLGVGLGLSSEPTRDLALLQPLFLDSMPTRDTTIALQVTHKWLHWGVSKTALTRIIAHARAIGIVHLIAASSDARLAHELGTDSDTIITIFDTMLPWKRAIAQSRMLITPDTGAAHLAGMLGTPTVDCFPSQDYRMQTTRWLPWAAPSVCAAIRENEDEFVQEVCSAITTLR
jgi:ADP-heptose:LPS heptosyltransferase